MMNATSRMSMTDNSERCGHAAAAYISRDPFQNVCRGYRQACKLIVMQPESGIESFREGRFPAREPRRRAMLRCMLRPRLATALISTLLFVALPANSRVTRVEVASRNDVLNGQAFGDAGAYERIAGR